MFAIFGCVTAIALVFGPRLLLAIWWTMEYAQGEPSGLWKALGFLFMPWTLAAYTWIMVHGGDFSGLHLVLMIVAVLFDLGGWGSSNSSRSKRE